MATGLTCVGDVFAGIMEGAGRLLIDGLKSDNRAT